MSAILPLKQRHDGPSIVYDLTDLVLLRDAPKRWPVFTFTELNRAAKAGELPHILKSRRRYVTEQHIKHWIKTKEQACAGSSNLANTGSTRSLDPATTTGSGMTDDQEIFVAEALRQAISGRPNSH